MAEGLKLYRNWRAIAEISDPYIRKTLTEAPLASNDELARRFPEYYGNDPVSSLPIPWTELVKTAEEIKRRDGLAFPYIPTACEELGIPIRNFTTLEDGRVGHECEYLSMSQVYEWSNARIGDTVLVDNAEYIVITTNLNPADIDYIDERWPFYCTVSIVLSAFVAEAKTAWRRFSFIFTVPCLLGRMFWLLLG